MRVGSTIISLLGPPREGRPFFVSGGLVVLVPLLAPQQHRARPVELPQPLLGDAQQAAHLTAVPALGLQARRLRPPPGARQLGLDDLGLEPDERAALGW